MKNKIQVLNFGEQTIDQFQTITSILNDDSVMMIERYINAIEYMLTETNQDLSILDELTDDELFDVIKKLNKQVSKKTKLPHTILINGKAYKAYKEGETFKLKARDLALIERLIKEHPKGYYSYVLAVLFKSEQDINNYDMDLINYKADLFKKLNAVTYFQYVIQVLTKIKDNIIKLNDLT